MKCKWRPRWSRSSRSTHLTCSPPHTHPPTRPQRPHPVALLPQEHDLRRPQGARGLAGERVRGGVGLFLGGQGVSSADNPLPQLCCVPLCFRAPSIQTDQSGSEPCQMDPPRARQDPPVGLAAHQPLPQPLRAHAQGPAAQKPEAHEAPAGARGAVARSAASRRQQHPAAKQSHPRAHCAPSSNRRSSNPSKIRTAPPRRPATRSSPRPTSSPRSTACLWRSSSAAAAPGS